MTQMIPTPHQWWQADGSGGDLQVTPDAARTFLTDFGHSADTLKTLPDPDVLKLHETVSASHKKYVDTAVANAGEGWRQAYVSRLKANAEKAGDKEFDEKKMLGRLQRYASPDAAFDALVGLQNKVSAGELKTVTPYPEKGTDEEKAAWRKSQGLPEKPEGYTVKLPTGMALGADDEPVVDAFKKVALENNYTPAQVNGAVKWYLDTVQAQAAARADEDVKARDSVEDALRAEWGGDFRRNKAMIEAFWDLGGKDVKEAILNARTGDGTPLASHPAVLRYFADRAREVIDASTLVPGDAGGMVKSVDEEIRQLKAWMGAPVGSAEHKRYWGDPNAQSRYRHLVEQQAKLARRARAA